MTVGELIETLKGLDPNIPVCVYDGCDPSDIVIVNKLTLECVRENYSKPYLMLRGQEMILFEEPNKKEKDEIRIWVRDDITKDFGTLPILPHYGEWGHGEHHYFYFESEFNNYPELRKYATGGRG